MLISANPKPGKSPVAFVDPAKYKGYALNPDLDYIPVIQAHLTAAGIPSKLDTTFDCMFPSQFLEARPEVDELRDSRHLPHPRPYVPPWMPAHNHH